MEYSPTTYLKTVMEIYYLYWNMLQYINFSTIKLLLQLMLRTIFVGQHKKIGKRQNKYVYYEKYMSVLFCWKINMGGGLDGEAK